MSSVADYGAGRGHSAESLLAGQTRILEMIASNATLEETLTSLVLLIESQFEGMLCSIVLLDDDGQHIHHLAAPSLPPCVGRLLALMSAPPRFPGTPELRLESKYCYGCPICLFLIGCLGLDRVWRMKIDFSNGRFFFGAQRLKRSHNNRIVYIGWRLAVIRTYVERASGRRSE